MASIWRRLLTALCWCADHAAVDPEAGAFCTEPPAGADAGQELLRAGLGVRQRP